MLMGHPGMSYTAEASQLTADFLTTGARLVSVLKGLQGKGQSEPVADTCVGLSTSDNTQKTVGLDWCCVCVFVCCVCVCVYRCSFSLPARNIFTQTRQIYFRGRQVPRFCQTFLKRKRTVRYAPLATSGR